MIKNTQRSILTLWDLLWSESHLRQPYDMRSSLQRWTSADAAAVFEVIANIVGSRSDVFPLSSFPVILCVSTCPALAYTPVSHYLPFFVSPTSLFSARLCPPCCVFQPELPGVNLHRVMWLPHDPFPAFSPLLVGFVCQTLHDGSLVCQTSFAVKVCFFIGVLKFKNCLVSCIWA